MNNWFVISIVFLHRRYHGRAEWWPPSPLRLFQAIVAGARLGRWLHEDPVNTGQVLSWLERLGAPELILAPRATECCSYRLAVPHNQADTEVAAWIRGVKPLEDLLRSTKEIKEVRPNHVGRGAIRYAWPIPEADYNEAHKACSIVRRMFALGTGLDHVVADAKVYPHQPDKDEDGLLFRLSAHSNGRILDAPVCGTLTGLTERHALRLDRLRNRQLREGDHMVYSGRVAYTHEHHTMKPVCLIFTLCDPSDDDSFAPMPSLSAAILAAAVRDELVARLREAIQRFPEYVRFEESDIERFVLGRGAGEEDKPSRIVFSPLPSIGHDHADGAIRRFMVVVPSRCPIPAEIVLRALDHRVVEVTSDGTTCDRVRLMVIEESNLAPDKARTEWQMRARYIPPKGARIWRSVTPVILPGPLTRRGMAKDSPEASARADFARRQRAFDLADVALGHAGLDSDNAIITRLQMEPFRAREPRADADWRLPLSSKTGKIWLAHRPRVHLEITFPEPVQGPLTVGDGRFLGLGLFTQADEPVQSNIRVSVPPVEAMLMSITTANGNNHALLSVVRTLPLAELLHRATVSHATASNTGFSAALIGCDEAGKPLRGSHEHAHILPLDLDEDSHLEHFLIWAPMGLDSTAQAAVRSTRRTFTKNRNEPLRLALAGAGTLDEFRSLSGIYGDGLRSVLGPPNGCTEWISLTPFVPPRFLKRRGRNTIEGQIVAELASRGLPAPVEVRRVDPRDDSRLLRQRHFIRSRRHGPAPVIDCGFQIGISFAEPLHGPLCLGYASHFGLGIFAAVV